MPKGPRAYKAIKYRMIRIGATQRDLAPKMGMSCPTLSSRLTGKVPWSLPEAYKLLEVLGLSKKDIYNYFPDDIYADISDELALEILKNKFI